MDRDPYAVLQLPRTATFEEVRAAYRRLAQATHPDRNPSPDAAQRFIEVHSAWLELRDNTALRARTKASANPRPSVRTNPRAKAYAEAAKQRSQATAANLRLLLVHERAALESGAAPRNCVVVRPALSGLLWPLLLPLGCVALAQRAAPLSWPVQTPLELGSLVLHASAALLLILLLPELFAAIRGKLAIWVGPGGVHDVRGSRLRSMSHDEIRALEFGYDPIGRLGFHPFYLEFLLGPEARPYRVRRPYGARELRRVIDLVLQQDAGTI